jgi:hypothetical protein
MTHLFLFMDAKVSRRVKAPVNQAEEPGGRAEQAAAPIPEKEIATKNRPPHFALDQSSIWVSLQ